MPKQRDPKTGRWMPRNTKDVLVPTVKVFVYGTLKKNYHNHHVLGPHAQFLGEAETTSRYRMYSAGFPVVLEDGDGHPVTGELYDVPPRRLEYLDGLEGEGYMYFRKVVEVTLKNGAPVQCYGYVGNPQIWNPRFREREPMRLNEHGQHEWPEPPLNPFVETMRGFPYANRDFAGVEKRVMAGVITGRLDDKGEPT